MKSMNVDVRRKTEQQSPIPMWFVSFDVQECFTNVIADGKLCLIDWKAVRLKFLRLFFCLFCVSVFFVFGLMRSSLMKPTKQENKLQSDRIYALSDKTFSCLSVALFSMYFYSCSTLTHFFKKNNNNKMEQSRCIEWIKITIWIHKQIDGKNKRGNAQMCGQKKNTKKAAMAKF